MAMDSSSNKTVLLTSNGDDVSKYIALNLAKYGCSLALVGDEARLHGMAREIAESVGEGVPIHVVGLDMSRDEEAVFDLAVDNACALLGSLDAFVNCYSYEGTYPTPTIL